MRRQFRLRPSRCFAAMLMAAHGLACLAVLLVALPLWTQAALTFLLLCSLIYHLWRDAWLYAPSAAALLMLEQDQVTLETRDGKRLEGRISRHTLVTPLITVLLMLPHGARLARSVVILPDSLDDESFRLLRVWLRWGVELNPGRKN